jgi:hypothetical protein
MFTSGLLKPPSIGPVDLADPQVSTYGITLTLFIEQIRHPDCLIRTGCFEDATRRSGLRGSMRLASAGSKTNKG